MRARALLPGLLLWVGALALAWLLPGRAWPGTPAPVFHLQAALPFVAGGALLLLLVGGLALLGGPAPAGHPLLAAVEGLPPLLWGLGLLAAWPAVWGPPGALALGGLFALAALPTEWRWVAQALPGEHPFPAAYGSKVLRRVRRLALARILPRWLAARAPVWLTATLVLERLLGVPALGSDWMARVVARDRPGLALWVGAFALLWAVGRRLERP